MIAWLRNVLTCFRNDDHEVDRILAQQDVSLWANNLMKHSHGEFSMAVVKANANIEDHSQVETGIDATFIGVYDGHGGSQASTYVSDHLYNHLNRLATARGEMAEDIIKAAFAETETGFLDVVQRNFKAMPLIAATGSCCLVGIIWKKALYVANLGDSRAVLGRLTGSKIIADQLTDDHNASRAEVRQELMNVHYDDAGIVVQRQGVWRIKGIIQVSRSIGDAFLKSQEFALSREHQKFYLRGSLVRPVIRADPDIISRKLLGNDRFIIFASDGLWEFLTNQEAVKIVHKNTRDGIAQRLFATAFRRAAKRRNVSYNHIRQFVNGGRREFHDDISIVVVFIDCDTLASGAPQVSVHGFDNTVGTSNFNFGQEFASKTGEAGPSNTKFERGESSNTKTDS